MKKNSCAVSFLFKLCICNRTVTSITHSAMESLRKIVAYHENRWLEFWHLWIVSVILGMLIRLLFEMSKKTCAWKYNMTFEACIASESHTVFASFNAICVSDALCRYMLLLWPHLTKVWAVTVKVQISKLLNFSQSTRHFSDDKLHNINISTVNSATENA